jgi:hypothetical protein
MNIITILFLTFIFYAHLLKKINSTLLCQTCDSTLDPRCGQDFQFNLLTCPQTARFCSVYIYIYIIIFYINFIQKKNFKNFNNRLK